MSRIGLRCGRRERVFRYASAVGLARRLIPFALVAVTAAPAVAQQNLGFESVDELGMPTGWSATGGGDVTTGQAPQTEGRERSLQVTRTSAAGITRVAQRMPAAELRAAGRAQRLRLSGTARTSSAAVNGALWLRVDGPRGPLFLDSYGYGREPNAERAPSLAASARNGSGWQRYELELPLPADVDEIAFGVSVRGEGTAWFDALELTVTSADSAPPAAAVAVRYVEAAIAVMREHSLRRAEIDWPSLREQTLDYARGAASAAQAHLAVRFAVRELGDRHSYLQSPAVTRELQTTAVANARTGAVVTAPRGRHSDSTGRVRGVAEEHHPTP
jgi:hypothetical protein